MNSTGVNREEKSNLKNRTHLILVHRPVKFISSERISVCLEHSLYSKHTKLQLKSFEKIQNFRK